jgi:hypothetical protein
MPRGISKFGAQGAVVAALSWSVGMGLASLPGGCAAAVPHRQAGVVEGNQGGSWEVVVPGPASAALLAEASGSPEYSRRDVALGLRTYDPSTAADPWPPRDAPRLDRARRLFIRGRSDEILYFRRDRGELFWRE